MIELKLNFRYMSILIFILFNSAIVSSSDSLSTEKNTITNSSQDINKLADTTCGTLLSCPKVLCDLKSKDNLDFCNTVKCNGLSIEDCPVGSVYQEGLLMCGCCPGCAEYLKAGETCSRQPIPPEISSECKGNICPVITNTCPEGMECALVGPNAFTCTVTGDSTELTCANKLALALDGQLHWTPSCEHDGSYSPKQCKGDFYTGTCFCVNAAGQRIFGHEKWADSGNMTCACSRQAHELRNAGLISTLHCTEDGNYEALQCDTDSKLCYCVDTKTGKTTGAVLPEKEWKYLPCYTLNITAFDRDGEYLRMCESDWASVQKLAKEANLHGLDVLSGRTVTCDYDGSYAQIQNIDGRRNCVRKNGGLIGNNFQTEVDANPKTTCQCVRDEIYAEQLGEPFLLDCVVPTGNYAEISPVPGEAPVKYSCVDADGFFFPKDTLNYPHPEEKYKCCLLLGTNPNACKDLSEAERDKYCYDPAAADNTGKFYPCTYWPV